MVRWRPEVGQGASARRCEPLRSPLAHCRLDHVEAVDIRDRARGRPDISICVAIAEETFLTVSTELTRTRTYRVYTHTNIFFSFFSKEKSSVTFGESDEEG